MERLERLLVVENLPAKLLGIYVDSSIRTAVIEYRLTNSNQFDGERSVEGLLVGVDGEVLEEAEIAVEDKKVTIRITDSDTVSTAKISII